MLGYAEKVWRIAKGPEAGGGSFVWEWKWCTSFESVLVVLFVDNGEEVVVSAMSHSLWRGFWICFDRGAGLAVFEKPLVLFVLSS